MHDSPSGRAGCLARRHEDKQAGSEHGRAQLPQPRGAGVEHGGHVRPRHPGVFPVPLTSQRTQGTALSWRLNRDGHTLQSPVSHKNGSLNTICITYIK